MMKSPEPIAADIDRSADSVHVARRRWLIAAASLLAVLALVALALSVWLNSGRAPVFPPKPPGLVALWHAEGNGNDAVGKNHAASLHRVGFAKGVFGRAFKIDGINTTSPSALLAKVASQFGLTISGAVCYLVLIGAYRSEGET